MNKNRSEQNDYDSPWKEFVEKYFEEFIEFFFPIAYQVIDWSNGYEFLDAEFKKIAPESEIGNKAVDKLVKVWRTNGNESWVLIHVELQAHRDHEFAKRMFVYNYRIFGHFDRTVVSFAVLGDSSKNWKPDSFSYRLWGCQVGITYPVVKLLDYLSDWNSLENSNNPFAIATMAHLKSLETKHSIEDRIYWKYYFIRTLIQKGYNKEDIFALFRFVNWILQLPKEVEEEFWNKIQKSQEKEIMPYTSNFEIMLKEKGSIQTTKELLIETLKIRFKQVPDTVVNQIEMIPDISTLRFLHATAIQAESLEQLKDKIPE